MGGNMRSVVGDSEAPMMGGRKHLSKKGGMGGNMRSVVGDSSSSMMGGKKHRSKKGGMGGNMRSVVGNSEAVSSLPMMGGKKHRSVSSKKSRSRRAHSSHRRTAKKGGMGASFGAIIQEAIVPFGIFAWQKRSQRNKKSSSHSKSHRRR